MFFSFLFFSDRARMEIYTLSLHDALPISCDTLARGRRLSMIAMSVSSISLAVARARTTPPMSGETTRSEEHTSELQSRENLVCRLLLEKKKINFVIPLLSFLFYYVWCCLP